MNDFPDPSPEYIRRIDEILSDELGVPIYLVTGATDIEPEPAPVPGADLEVIHTLGTEAWALGEIAAAESVRRRAKRPDESKPPKHLRTGDAQAAKPKIETVTVYDGDTGKYVEVEVDPSLPVTDFKFYDHEGYERTVKRNLTLAERARNGGKDSESITYASHMGTGITPKERAEADKTLIRHNQQRGRR